MNSLHKTALNESLRPAHPNNFTHFPTTQPLFPIQQAFLGIALRSRWTIHRQFYFVDTVGR